MPMAAGMDRYKFILIGPPKNHPLRVSYRTCRPRLRKRSLLGPRPGERQFVIIDPAPNLYPALRRAWQFMRPLRFLTPSFSSR